MTEQKRIKLPSVDFTIQVPFAPVRIAQQCLTQQDQDFRKQHFKDHKVGDTEVVLLIEPNSELHKTLKAKALEAAAEAQKVYPAFNLDPSKLQMPFKNGTVFADKMKDRAAKDPSKKPMEWFRGFALLKATGTAKFPPKMAQIHNGAIVDVPADKFYPGAFVYAAVSFKGYEGQEQGPLVDGERSSVPFYGVKAYLNAVLFVKDGDRLGGGGGRSAADTFKGVVGQKTQVDPMDEEPGY